MTDTGMDGKGDQGESLGDDDHQEYTGGPSQEGEEGEGEGVPVDVLQADALMQSAVSQGLFMQRQKCPDTARKIQQLTAAKVDWRKALAAWLTQRQFGSDRTNWKRRSRRGHALNLTMPSRYSERTGRLVLAIDTSGSIGDQELTGFLSEVSGLLQTVKPAQVELIYWGSDIAGHETYLPNEYARLASVTRPKEGGGTDITVVRDWVREQQNQDVTGIVVLTDGYVGDWGMGTWPCPTFIALNTSAPCPLTHARM
jgi:predicted metal-dependent peptidase